MKKLKNINFKALFVDHGEKMGLGLMVLLVLGALASTSWSRYANTPEELKKKADDARQRITSPTNMWPQEKAEAFKIVDFTDRASQIFTPMDIAKYEFSSPLYHPLYRKRELAREPEYMPVEYLLASSGLAILGVADQSLNAVADGSAVDGTTGSSGTPTTAAGTNETNAGFGFKLPGQQPTGTPGSGGSGTTPFATPGSVHGAPASGRPAVVPPGGAMTPGMEGMSGSGMPGSGGASGVTARGARFVAVRGIFPLRQQLEKYQRALNVTGADANNLFELFDFVLERQAAVAGTDPWAGKWEPVNVESALEVLRESSDFELDPVQTGVTDAVITMSLPYRLLEYWGDNATHPNIKDFQLKPEDMEREMKLYNKLVEEYEKAQLQSQPKVQRRGLSGGQRDLRQMGNDMMASQYAGDFMRNVTSDMAADGGPRMALPDIKQRLTANGRLLLFRYFDFDVQPGMAYRYRVKLKIRNPNFERPVEEVVDRSVVEGPERETDWSNISNPAVVPTGVNYFLKDVERDPLRDDKRTNKPVASIAMFEWNTKLGTMLADTLKILTVGQFISEEKKSIVIDVATPSYKDDEKVAFVTEDVLIDASGDYDIVPDLHPDLGVKAERGKKEVKLGLLPEAIVVTGLGEVKQLDPVSEKPKEELLKRRVDAERKMFEQFKDAENQPNSALEGGGNAYDAMMGIGAGSSAHGAPKTSKKKNPKKLESGSGSAMMEGSGSAHGGSSSSGKKAPAARNRP